MDRSDYEQSYKGLLEGRRSEDILKVMIKIPNTLNNQELSRKIRALNQSHHHEIEISFSEDLQSILLQGDTLFIPDPSILDDQLEYEGQLKVSDNLYKLVPLDKGKTVNLHLDSHLVKELEEIRKHVSSKTQHDILLEIFKRGIHEYKNHQE